MAQDNLVEWMSGESDLPIEACERILAEDETQWKEVYRELLYDPNLTYEEKVGYLLATSRVDMILPWGNLPTKEGAERWRGELLFLLAPR